MGCGASKAAQVVETDITILDHPAVTRSGPSSSPTRSMPSPRRGEGEGEGVGLVPSDQSGIERALQEAIARPPDSSGSTLACPSLELTNEEREHLQAGEGPHGSDTPNYPHPVSFEVSMSPDGSIAARKAPPRRLAKLDSAPKLTPELLAEKHRVVGERKKKELEKRSSSQRLSKKERLRREIMRAREADSQGQHAENEGERSSNREDRAEATEEQKRREEYARDKAYRLLPAEGEGASFDAMEVDNTYNTDQSTGFWDNSQGSHDNVVSKNSNASFDFFHDEGDTTNLL